jgi:hypothetical protein
MPETETLKIHFVDHNMHDRYFVVPRDKALAILRDATTADDRMGRIWTLAVEDGKADGDPRMSQLDDADMFLVWPSDHPAAVGFQSTADWQRELDEVLEAFTGG